jgi:hypothetical protein
MRIKGGHIGLSTGRSAHEKLWPDVSAWLHAHDAPAQPAHVAPAHDATAQRPAAAHGARAQKDMPVAARKVARPRDPRPADSRKRKR